MGTALVIVAGGMAAFLGAGLLEVILWWRERRADRSWAPLLYRVLGETPPAIGAGSRERPRPAGAVRRADGGSPFPPFPPNPSVPPNPAISPFPPVTYERATEAMPGADRRGARARTTEVQPDRPGPPSASAPGMGVVRSLARSGAVPPMAQGARGVAAARGTIDLAPAGAVLPPPTVVELSPASPAERRLASDMVVRLVLRDRVYHASVAGRPRAWLGSLPLFPSSLPVTEAAASLVIEDRDRLEKVFLGDHVPLAPVASGLLDVIGGAGLPRDGGGVYRDGMLVLSAVAASSYVAVAVRIDALVDDPVALERATNRLNDRLSALGAVTTPLDQGRSAARAAEIYARTELRGAAGSVVVQAGDEGALAAAWIGDIDVVCSGHGRPRRDAPGTEAGIDGGVSWLTLDPGAGEAVVTAAGFTELAARVRARPIARPPELGRPLPE